MTRHRIDIGIGDQFIVEVEGERFGFEKCYKFAEIANIPAYIFDTVLQTADERFIHLTVVADDGSRDSHGVRRGWYTARLVNADMAKKFRDSWAILREQPALPSGPWN